MKKSDKKRILIINLGWEQEPLIDELDKRNLKIYGVHNSENYYKDAEFVDVHISDFRDVKSISNFAEKIQPDAVISDQCDYSFFCQAYVSEKFNLPGPSIKQAQISSNKYFQRLKAEKENILIPNFALVKSTDDINKFLGENDLPIILKPVDNRGSIGVNKIQSTSEIREAFYDSLKNSNSGLLIVEEYISGMEITVDGYVFNGESRSLALATKKSLNEKDQVAVDIIYPGELDEALYTKVIEINEQVTSSLGYSFGMTHSEYKVAKTGGIYLIESANRGGGVFTSEIIVPNVSDIDVLNQYIDDSLGKTGLHSPDQISRNPVILKFISLKEGILKKVEGLELIEVDPSLLKIRFSISEGETITRISSDANRHGFVIVKSQNPRVKAEQIINKLKFKYL